eukprot:SAG31_NODE_995_length_10494_cov_8.173641_4_plen_680_part_00
MPLEVQFRRSKPLVRFGAVSGKGLLSRFCETIREIRVFNRAIYGTNRESVTMYRTQNDACRGGAGADDDHMAPTPAQLALTALFQLDRTGQLSPAELRRHFEGGWSKVLAKEVFASGNSPTCLGQVDVAKADAHTPSWSVDEDQVAEKAARGSVSQQGPDEAAAVVSNHETSQHGEPETNDHTDTVSPPQPRNATDATVLARAAAAASPSCVGGALRPGLLRLPAEVVAHLCAKVGGRTRRTLRLVCVQLAHQCRAVSAHRLWSTVYMDSQKANVMSRWRAEDRKSVAEDSNQNIANAAPMEQDENPGLAELLAQNSLDDIDEPDITRPDAFCQSEIDAIHNFLRIQRLANRGDAVGRILLDRNYPLAARKALQTRYTLRRVRREVKRNANDCRATSPTDFEFGADTVHGEVVAVRHQGKARFDPDIESRVAAGQIGMPSARITRWLQLVPPSLWYDAIAAAVAQWIRVEGLSQVQMDVSQDATPMETAVSGVLAALARPPLEMTNVPPAAIFFYFALHPLQDKLFLNNFFLLWTKRLQDRRHMVDVLVLRRSLLKRRFMRWSDRIKSRLKLEIEKKVPVPSGKSKPLNSSAVNMPNNVDILLRRSLYCVEPEVVEIRKALNVAHEKQQNMRNRLRTARLVLANTLREELPSMDQTVALTAQKLATMLDRNADEGSKHV